MLFSGNHKIMHSARSDNSKIFAGELSIYAQTNLHTCVDPIKNTSNLAIDKSQIIIHSMILYMESVLGDGTYWASTATWCSILTRLQARTHRSL